MRQEDNLVDALGGQVLSAFGGRDLFHAHRRARVRKGRLLGLELGGDSANAHALSIAQGLDNVGAEEVDAGFGQVGRGTGYDCTDSRIVGS